MKPTRAIMAQYPSMDPPMLIVDAADAAASSVPPEAVVPFGRVPFKTMVLVPLISEIWTSVELSLE